MAKQIFLNEIITEWSVNDVKFNIENTSEKEIDIFISSYGGSVNKGFELANYIKAVNAKGDKKINTNILSHADSIATVIFLAAPKSQRYIVDSSTMFKHEPRLIIFDEVTQASAEKMAKELEIQKNRIADFYVQNIEGLEKEEALALMRNETTLTAKDMMSYGIVESVLENFEIAANKNIDNSNQFKIMGLFNKKEKGALNVVATKQGKQIAFFGELKSGAEIAIAGVDAENYSGEYELEDNRKLIVDEKNIVTEILAKKEDEKKEENASTEEIVNAVIDGVMGAVEEKLKEINDSFDAKIENLRKTGGTHKPGKKNDSQNFSLNSEDVQVYANVKIREKLKEIEDAKRKNREE